jgi:hypothetical protein
MGGAAPASPSQAATFSTHAYPPALQMQYCQQLSRPTLPNPHTEPGMHARPDAQFESPGGGARTGAGGGSGGQVVVHW